MGTETSGRYKQKHDWSLLVAQYDADYAPRKITLKEYCKETGIEYGLASKAFARERTRTALAIFHDRNKPLLLAAQSRVMTLLADSQNWEDKKAAAAFALKVYEIVAQREEPKPELHVGIDAKLPSLFPESTMAQQAIVALTRIADSTQMEAPIEERKADE